jgi:predicted AlkP superfamily pyrophosphatase or phosphodiesterase
MTDDYPDAEVFAAAGMLVARFLPDYLLVHPMAMDYLGETYGADSAEYRNQAIVQDQIMAAFIPSCLEVGYTVLVTADHGINNDKMHGGTRPDVRHVPLYWFRRGGGGQGNTYSMVSQLQIAPMLCRLLDVPVPATMGERVIDDFEALVGVQNAHTD